MSVFSNILHAIFGHANAAGAPPANAGVASSGSAAPSPGAPSGGAGAAATVDVAAVMDDKAAHSKEKLDWKHSIVDLMKLLNLDSSLNSRRELAKELGYTGDTNDSATMNVWLHQQVMKKLAENGGKVPADLH